MKKYDLLKNTISSLIFQIVTIICGFILPRMILQCYGSEVNGLVNSITQFLSVISFLEFGVGAVVQSSLYKPLAEKDYEKQSDIYVSAQKFFTRLAKILLIYVCVLIVIYPFINVQGFGFFYTTTLILAISISSFAQYYFGIVNSLLLSADQKGYIQYNVQIVTLILNTICCVLLMIAGYSIHLVKLATSLIYLVRPIYLSFYVKKHYKIDKKKKVIGEPIEQKWNGVAQHIAAIVLDGTDTIVLTLFAGLKAVSVYSVYYLVVSGIKQMFNAVTGGIQATLGDIYARNEQERLKKVFFLTEWLIHTATMFIMGCVACLITPFVLVYTNGVNDAEYNQLFFGYILTLAYAAYCLRLPYHMMIRASGRYKETQNNYIISAIVNLILSIALVKSFGLIGVAVGTFAAMFLQAIWLAFYNAQNILKYPLKNLFKQLGIDVLTILLGMILSRNFKLVSIDLKSWIIMGIKIVAIWCLVVFMVNLIFYRDNIKKLLKVVKFGKG